MPVRGDTWSAKTQTKSNLFKLKFMLVIEAEMVWLKGGQLSEQQISLKLKRKTEI